MFNIVLVEPQIPPNTGNVARLCAATEMKLHLVGRLGFEVSDRYLKRAGLDYWEWVDVEFHDSVEEFFERVPAERLHFFSKKSTELYCNGEFLPGDYLVFGSETKGLPKWLFDRFPERFKTIPIFNKNVRSLNLSSAVAVVAYEALRQNGFRRS